MKKSKGVFRLVAKSLGEKASKDDKEADKVALIRLFMFLSIFITNCFIVYGVLRTHHFPTNNNKKIEVVIDASTLPVYQTPPPRQSNKPFEFE
jgi:hypothetical protein